MSDAFTTSLYKALDDVVNSEEIIQKPTKFDFSKTPVYNPNIPESPTSPDSGCPSSLTSPVSPGSPIISEIPTFAFNIGVVNAPRAGVQVIKRHLPGGAFQVYIETEEDKIPIQKIRIFSSEELQKQSELVDEWKKKVQNVMNN